MLEIKQLKSYKVPKYPEGHYYELKVKGDRNPGVTFGILAAGLSTLVLYTSCNCQPIGVTGPPPVPSLMISEQEARMAIKKIFQENGIEFKEDFPYSFVSDNETIQVNLDGYNENKKVGYEYFSEQDITGADSSANEKLRQKYVDNITSPMIEVLSPANYYDEETKKEALQQIEKEVNEFIKSLRSSGNL
jgi:hypothetical protein